MGSLPSYLPSPYLPIDGDQPKERIQEGHKLMPTVLKNLSIHFTNYLFSISITQVTKKKCLEWMFQSDYEMLETSSQPIM